MFFLLISAALPSPARYDKRYEVEWCGALTSENSSSTHLSEYGREEGPGCSARLRGRAGAHGCACSRACSRACGRTRPRWAGASGGAGRTRRLPRSRPQLCTFERRLGPTAVGGWRGRRLGGAVAEVEEGVYARYHNEQHQYGDRCVEDVEEPAHYRPAPPVGDPRASPYAVAGCATGSAHPLCGGTHSFSSGRAS